MHCGGLEHNRHYWPLIPKPALLENPLLQAPKEYFRFQLGLHNSHQSAVMALRLVRRDQYRRFLQLEQR